MQLIWKKFHGDLKELLPENVPRIIEREFMIGAFFVDNDFADDNLTLGDPELVLLCSTLMERLYRLVLKEAVLIKD